MLVLGGGARAVFLLAPVFEGAAGRSQRAGFRSISKSQPNSKKVHATVLSEKENGTETLIK